MLEFYNLNDAVLYIYKTASNYANEGVTNNIGGPFGAGIILEDDNKFKIVSIARNTVISTSDPTCHAEVNAIREACNKLRSPFLDNCVLVTTAKSCPMCLSAACWARIKTIYYGVDYSDATTAGFKDATIEEYIQGKNDSLVKEIYLSNKFCKEPFVTWNNKEDRINY